MLDTMQQVLERGGISESLAASARDAVESSAIDGVVREPPRMVLGGGVRAIKDAEDGGVLDTAIAGQSDLLVTHNMDDFSPGPRSDIDATVIGTQPGDKPAVLLLRHPRLQDGLVIATVAAAGAWLLGGTPPPQGLLPRFRSGWIRPDG